MKISAVSRQIHEKLKSRGFGEKGIKEAHVEVEESSFWLHFSSAS